MIRCLLWKTWGVLEDKKINANEACYIFTMRSYVKGDTLRRYLFYSGVLLLGSCWSLCCLLTCMHHKFFDFLLNVDAYIKFAKIPGVRYPEHAGENRDLMLLPIYNDFLNSCLKLQYLHYANLCLDMMERQAVGKNEITFGCASEVLQKNLSAVHEIWKEYVKYYNPTILSLRFFIWAFSSLKDLESARESQDCIAAEELMVQMKALGLKPSKVTYDAFIKAVSSRRRLKEMQMNKVYPCETSLASLSVSCSKALKLDLAKDLLDKVSGNVGVLPFNAFLAACVALDKPEIAVRVLSRMKKMEVQFDMQTYELLFSLFGLVNAPYEEGNMLSREEATKRIKAIELDMAKNGLQHSFTTMKNLLSALGAEGQKSELVQYLHVAEKLFEPMDSKRRATLHNIVLQSLVELKESSMAINIFKNMRRRGFLPDTATYSIMIECCSVTECFRSALQLLSLMLRDGYYPTTVTYTSLMKVVKDNEHFYEELNLLDRASTEECDPLQRSVGDAVMYNTVLLKARAKGRIDIIEFLLEKMHQDKIQPNPVTCSIVLDAYTNQGYINTALESLQVLSLRMISEDKEELQKHQPEIEELILSQSPEAESQILQHFDSDVNFATALLNLRCCSLIGFSTPWSPDETAWAKTLSANFKSAFGA
ncbi:unnamed protein product [Rhodiola kirilowii]